ncbi:MAG: DMT family transporter [Maritimibacter sp.]|nr:DMT family transporter [Maritimibacter sp.]
MNPKLGIALKLGAVVAFIAMQSLIKSTGGRVPAGEIVFFRSFFAFPVILAWLAWTHELHVGWRTANPMSHVWRGVVGTSSMGLGFAGLMLLPLPEVTALSYAAPILTVIFAAMFLGEEVRVVRIFAVALGMTGVVIVLAPQLTAFSEGHLGATRALGAVLVLLSATFAALAQIFLRKMVAHERAATVVFYFTVSSTLFSLFTIPFGWVLPSGRDALVLILAGLAGGVGQGLLTSSYRFAHASLVAPFDYASMLLAIAIGYVVFAEVPTGQTLAGATLVVAAGILIIWRETRLGLDRDKPRGAGAAPQG